MRNTLVMIVLALLAAGLWFATWQRPERNLRAEDGLPSESRGLYIRGARILGTDEDGRVTYRISAERLDELPDEDRLELTGVDIEYQPPDEAPWSISAANASSTKDISQLELAGDVEISNPGDHDTKPVTIVTQQLTFWPDTSSAESNEPVEIRFGSLHLRGAGLRAHLKGHSLRLESDVHGTLLP